jgi:hypothetical protein
MLLSKGLRLNEDGREIYGGVNFGWKLILAGQGAIPNKHRHKPHHRRRRFNLTIRAIRVSHVPPIHPCGT